MTSVELSISTASRAKIRLCGYQRKMVAVLRDHHMSEWTGAGPTALDWTRRQRYLMGALNRVQAICGRTVRLTRERVGTYSSSSVASLRPGA